MGVRQACFACIVSWILFQLSILWGGESGYSGGSMLVIAISQFFDLQAIAVPAAADGITDKLP